MKTKVITVMATILILFFALAAILNIPQEPVPVDIGVRYLNESTLVDITPPPPGIYESFAPDGGSVPPTRVAGDPLSGNQMYGADFGARLLSTTWSSEPTGCTESSCTTSNISWTTFTNNINAQAAYNVTLADGTTRSSPTIYTIPGWYMYGENDSSCGSTADPCNIVTAPSWLLSDCKFTFQSPSGKWYEGFRYDVPLCVNRLKQYVSEFATQYGNNDNVVAIRLNVGYVGESVPNIVHSTDYGVTTAQLLAAHESTVTCTEYMDFLQDMTEHAYTVWTVAYNKPVYAMLGPGACASGINKNGQGVRWTLENNASFGGWSLSGTEKAIGYSLNSNFPDRGDSDCLSGSCSFGYTYEQYNYLWYRIGDWALANDRGTTYESGGNPNTSFTPDDDDPWAFQTWEWYTMAGVHTDVALNNYYWKPYGSALMYEVNTYLIGDTWPYRGWVLFRDAEHPTYGWNSTSTYSGYNGTWHNWLNLPNSTEYTQACNADLTGRVDAEESSRLAAGNTVYHVPCDVALPTPAVTPRPTMTPGDMVDEMNRTFDRQALVLATSGDTSEMDIIIDTGHPNYAIGITTNVTVTLAYLDAGTDKIYTLLPTTGGTITNTLTKTNTGQWKRHTFTQANVTMGNTLTGVNNDAFIIIKNDGIRTEYLHELWVDRVPSGVSIPTATPTPTSTPSPTPTFTPSVTPTPTHTPTPVYTTGVRINEISPTNGFDWNLSGDITEADRWFELVNWSATAANIIGYSIGNGSETYTFTSPGYEIAAYGYYVFLAEDTMSIPVSGTLTLKDDEGATLSAITYGVQGDGECYSAVPNGSDDWYSDQVCTPGY